MTQLNAHEVREQFKEIGVYAKKHRANLGLIIFVLAVTLFAATPENVRADALPHPTVSEARSVDLQVAAIQNTYAEYGILPESDDRLIPHTLRVVATAYNSEVGQTDATPFITASGTTTRHGVIAANFLPIGTQVKIPKYYGDQIFVVEDRMHPRYQNRVDIWMETRAEARQFGVRTVEIEVYR